VFFAFYQIAVGTRDLKNHPVYTRVFSSFLYSTRRFKLSKKLCFVCSQILAIHGSVTYLHVGCDEVFQMGECPRCRPKIREDLFLSHVSNVARLVKKISPHTIPLIWDDMLRHVPAATLSMYKMNTLVEPMVNTIGNSIHVQYEYAG
jgi:Glycosyl hydrolase family 20, catalytic domain.